MTTCTITGVFESPEAITGQLVLTPDVSAVYTDTGIAVQERYRATIDPLDGTFSVTVPATDSGTPTDWTYSVTEDFRGGRFYHISAPTGTFDLKQLAEVPESVGTSRIGILSVQPGANVTVDDTDPLNPVVSASGGGGGGGAGTVTQVNGQNPDGSGHVSVTYSEVPGTPTLGSAAAANTSAFDAAGAATTAQAAAIASANAHSDAAVGLKVDSAHTYSAAGGASGYHLDVDLDFDSTTTTLPEPVMVRGRTTGSLRRAWWLNESGSPRAQAVKNEPAIKAYGPGGSYTGAVIQVSTTYDGTGGTSVAWGVDATGRPLLGPNQIQGINWIKLNVGDAVPAGLPGITGIVRV